MRIFFSVISSTKINSLQLFDLWNGPVTFNSYDPDGWTEVYINTPTQFNFTSSAFSQKMRFAHWGHGLQAEFTFTPNETYKPHGIELNTTNVESLYDNIVTVSDVFIAFKELSNGGLFGNESGNEFVNGIQFLNADVDGNGIFNESDTYKLLQHLTGVETLTEFTTLPYLIKLYNKSEYDGITKSNWNTKFNGTRNLLPFTLNGLNNTYNINVTWVGDVNLSHSAQQTQNTTSSSSMRTMNINSKTTSNQINATTIGEIVDNKIVITISVDPLQQELVGTQFQLNYDNSSLEFEKVEFITKGNPINFGTNRGSFIKLGSLITDGPGSLDNRTEYKIIFKSKTDVRDILGLTSISSTDAVNKSGLQLTVKLN